MTKKHLVFVINPKSGTRKKNKVVDAINNHLDKEQFTHEIVYTQYLHHGVEIAADAARCGAYGVVAVGGDGSISDVVQGLQGTSTILGIIPNGSGNGLARTLNIPLNAKGAIALINKNTAQQIDIGTTGNRIFISNAGVAFDALISRKFAKSKRRGFAAYSWLVTRYLWSYKAWDFDITIDGQKFNERAFMLNIANGKQFGYNFLIAPHADCTDGKLDVVIIRDFPRILGGVVAIQALTGNILKSPYVSFYRATEVTVTHPRLKFMQTDGDAYSCEHTVRFGIAPVQQYIFTGGTIN